MSGRPPEQVRIGAFVLRPCASADAETYTAVQLLSHDHLAQFEGWAQATPTVAASHAWFDWCRQSWEDGRGYFYCTYDTSTDELVGSVGLHEVVDDPKAFALGYWTAEAHTMRSAATLGAVAATAVAFDLRGVERVEIHCDVNNTVSARIPRRLGFQLRETRPRARVAPGEAGVVMVHVCERRWYPKTYAHRLWIEERA